VLDGRSVVVKPANGRGQLDRFLRSLADSAGRSAAVVLLSGPGTDGALGVQRVKEAGGLTICQKVADGTEGELPKTAMATGMIDLVLGLDDIPPRVLRAFDDRRTAALEPEDPKAEAPVHETLRDILVMIRIRTGHDFSAYKRATLIRRVARRMQVCATETIGEYLRYLRERPTELANLLRDFLISVTNFFRDPDAFDVFSTQVIPKLFEGKTANDQVRVWVAGCATGEEAYSIGILMSEHRDQIADPPQLQVFATDIDEEALAVARSGIYTKLIESDLSSARLERFFVRENDHYRVNKDLREMMLFSPHNLLHDPPFSRLDLVSCRNLLIYLNRDAQDRVLSTFHFALQPSGFLFLGSSESVDSAQLFAPIDAKLRLYSRQIAPSALLPETIAATARWSPARLPPPPLATADRPITSFGELHHRIVEQYAPPSVLINADLDVVHLSEHAGRFLEMTGGEPTRQVLRLAHPGLRFELRGAIYGARQPGSTGNDTRIVRFDDNGRTRVVEIRVRTVELPEVGRGSMLLLFDELDPEATPRAVAQDASTEPVVRQMEDDLLRTRDQLRMTIEQYETGLEELKASNEELHAMNEELRSATEELETSKEELQSVNEELTTVNHELKLKVDEVTRANSDMQNLMTSTEIGVVFLDRELLIKRFTPRATDVFNIIPADIGRPLAHVTHNLDTSDLSRTAAEVLRSLKIVEREVSSNDGGRYIARFLPYRSLDDRIEGVVLTLVEVTDIRRAQEARDRSQAALLASEERLALALQSAPIAVFTHDARLAITSAFLQGKPVVPDHALRAFAGDAADRYLAMARLVMATGTGQRAELEMLGNGGIRTYDFRIEARRDPGSVGVTAVGFDISPSKQAEAVLLESDRRKDEFLATLSHELRNPLTPLRVAFEVARAASNDPAKLAKAFSIMEGQFGVLIRLVDDLLDVSRFTHGKIQLDLAPVDPARIVTAALESIRPLIDEAKHEVRVDIEQSDLLVQGDLMRLTQVITNLLGNAAKYTPAGGHLVVSVKADSTRGKVVIRVSDDGVGIDPDLLPRVFDIFVQSRDERGRARGGLGVGLNLVRRIVELHRGTVAATSPGVGRGSTFTIELPMMAGKAG
jgi:two-component system CheB/CheR fusion protein